MSEIVAKLEPFIEEKINVALTRCVHLLWYFMRRLLHMPPATLSHAMYSGSMDIVPEFLPMDLGINTMYETRYDKGKYYKLLKDGFGAGGNDAYKTELHHTKTHLVLFIGQQKYRCDFVSANVRNLMLEMVDCQWDADKWAGRQAIAHYTNEDYSTAMSPWKG